MKKWIKAGRVEDIPSLGARVIRSSDGDIALFKTKEGQVYALRDKCPHKGGALSEGIVHGNNVTCPLHNWVISLQDGTAQGFDVGCTRTFEIRTEGATLYVALNETTEASQT